MKKTANQIADEALEKVAISPQMAQRALEKWVNRVAHKANLGGTKNPFMAMYERIQKHTPRTLSRASKGAVLPPGVTDPEAVVAVGLHDRLWNHLRPGPLRLH